MNINKALQLMEEDHFEWLMNYFKKSLGVDMFKKVRSENERALVLSLMKLDLSKKCIDDEEALLRIQALGLDLICDKIFDHMKNDEDRVQVSESNDSDLAPLFDLLKTDGRNPRVILKNWSLTCRSVDHYKAPELQVIALQGEVYGDPRFPDGTFITTTRVVDVVDYGDYKIAKTRSGSEYRLTKENVNPAAAERFPGYFEKLIVR